MNKELNINLKEKDISEAINPENIEANKKIKDVATGNSRAFNSIRKMGYEVELDDTAQKQFGRKYFGKNVTIKNPKTGRTIYGNFGHQYEPDALIAKADDNSRNGDKNFHRLKGKYRDRITADKDAFDYKNYLDKPLPEKENPEDKLTTVQRFKKDKQFLKDNEWEANQIDAARERMKNIRTKYNLKAESLEEDYSEVEDEAKEVQNPVYADATRQMKKTTEVKEDTTKVEKEEKHEEKAKNPKMVAAAKKLKLDESLFEDIDVSVKSKVKSFLLKKLDEFEDNIANVVASEIPEYDSSLCAEDTLHPAVKACDEAGYFYIKALVNSLFANTIKEDVQDNLSTDEKRVIAKDKLGMIKDKSDLSDSDRKIYAKYKLGMYDKKEVNEDPRANMTPEERRVDAKQKLGIK